jgi:hypothetical protein
VNFDDLLARCLPDHDALTDFAFLIEDGRFIEIGKLVRNTLPTVDVYESWYWLLFQSLCACEIFDAQQKDSAIALVAEYLYRHSIVTDHEINFIALCISLERLAVGANTSGLTFN